MKSFQRFSMNHTAMKKAICLFFFLLVLSRPCLSQNQPRFESPYNTKRHSVKTHASIVATGYQLAFKLSKSQYKRIRKGLVEYYNNRISQVRSYLVTDATVPALPESEGILVHQFLQEKLKDILTVNQYDKYRKFEYYPEKIFAKGAPI